MSWRPYKPINHDLVPIEAGDLVEGIEAKIYTQCGIVRHVYVRTLSACKRYASISYRSQGPSRPVEAKYLLWFRGKKPIT